MCEWDYAQQSRGFKSVERSGYPVQSKRTHEMAVFRHFFRLRVVDVSGSKPLKTLENCGFLDRGMVAEEGLEPPTRGL